MNHLDEGTIHAWLDGALSATEARDAQAHVDACAECSARVAEARGFIAGASRILTALDDVPAGVTPKRAPSTAPATKQWRAAPWVTGIAATLILAIGIRTYWRAPAPAVLADRAIVAADSTRVAPAAAEQEGLARTGVRAEVRSAAGAGVARAGASSGLAATQGAGIPERAEPVVSRDSNADRKKSRQDFAANEAPALPAPTLLLNRAPGPGAAPVVPVARNLAGCYPIEPPSAKGQLVEAAADMAGKVSAAARPLAQVRVSTRAAENAPPPGPPTMVLLDTLRHALGFVARSALTLEPLGSWNRIDGDSVRVDLMVRGLFTIAGNKRTECPQPR